MEQPAAGTPADPSFKTRDAASYDSVVDDFDLLTNRYTMPIAGKVIAMAGIRPGQRVLDVGCGTGVLALLAADETGPVGRVTGVDLSDGMLSKARVLAKARRLAERVEFVKGDAERMQFPDSIFDSVISLYALRHFPNPEQALREMYRCSVPGATTLVAVGSSPQFPSGAFLRAGLRLVSDRILALAGRGPLYATTFLDRLIERALGSPDHGEHAAWTHGVDQYSGTIAALMTKVGFQEIRSDWVGHSAQLQSVEDFWTLQVTLSSYARKRIQAASQAEVAALRAAFDRICGDRLARGASLVYRSGALVTTGRRPGR